MEVEKSKNEVILLDHGVLKYKSILKVLLLHLILLHYIKELVKVSMIYKDKNKIVIMSIGHLMDLIVALWDTKLLMLEENEKLNVTMELISNEQQLKKIVFVRKKIGNVILATKELKMVLVN